MVKVFKSLALGLVIASMIATPTIAKKQKTTLDLVESEKYFVFKVNGDESEFSARNEKTRDRLEFTDEELFGEAPAAGEYVTVYFLPETKKTEKRILYIVSEDRYWNPEKYNKKPDHEWEFEIILPPKESE